MYLLTQTDSEQYIYYSVYSSLLTLMEIQSFIVSALTNVHKHNYGV